MHDLIAIVDYGMGNLRSVEKGFLKVGVNARITSSPVEVDNACAVVLPGVGAFRDCMQALERLNLLNTITRSIEKGKPFLGICLGLQVLFSQSEEFGIYKGLDIFKGKVVRFPDSSLKVPHMGWNATKVIKDNPLFEGISDGSYFYFVHSYYGVPEDNDIRVTLTDYGVTFTSMAGKDNIFATQFHPEKSQKIGLQMLRNFGVFVKSHS
jgi:glutamine amidotransferase